MTLGRLLTWNRPLRRIAWKITITVWLRRALGPMLCGAILALAGPPPPERSEAERIARAADFLEHGSIPKQQRALATLGGIPGAETEGILLGLFDRLAENRLPLALWLDLFEAAARHRGAALKARLAERERATAGSNDPILAWRECLEGGDAEEGREVFESPQAGCIRCHSVGGRGGEIGPELAGLGLRTDRLYILESILQPSAVIAFGYSNVLLTLANGETVSGILSAESRDEVTITSVVDGKKQRFKSARIASRVELPSAMPPGFGQILSKRQLRDLVEYIVTSEPE